jgi:hypothetical protein
MTTDFQQWFQTKGQPVPQWVNNALANLLVSEGIPWSEEAERAISIAFRLGYAYGKWPDALQKVIETGEW